MSDARLVQAVRNNAIWCDTVCRTHGRAGEFRQEIWINRHQTPRFYPNAVTLLPQQMAAQLGCIDSLTNAGIPGEWAVKDSFHTLDLLPLGFRVLFEAEWIWRSSPRKPHGEHAGPRWQRVGTPEALAIWEATWSGPADTGARPERVFLPPLLRDPDVAVMAVYRDTRIVAGLIGNRAADAVGLSNVFASAAEAEVHWASGIAALLEMFPGLPVVGYESAPDLSTAHAVGFESLGALRVWAHGPENTEHRSQSTDS